MGVRSAVRRGFENAGVRCRTKRRTLAGQTSELINENKCLSLSGALSGICCLSAKVCLSVWGGFLINPPAGHYGQTNKGLTNG